MPDFQPVENEFLKSITEIIENEISNDQFGVSELANEVGMSRSNLLRKVKKLTNLSVSQFISQVRLNNAFDLLKQNSLTVSEVAFKVGFSSTSYFIKCFGDLYGYPPGEVGKRNLSENESNYVEKSRNKGKVTILVLSVLLLITISVLVVVFKPFSSKQNQLEKSIAVLPFINDSNDSTNVHIINGLMESILNNLQNIEDLRVISRTSVEKYRNTNKTIPEIAEELDVSYFVEGSGQKIGDKILLNVQLIEAPTDKHLWAKQYNKEVKDIFQLQIDVAKNIAEEIKAVITPEEEERISKVPTKNLVAYDYFLKGLDLFHKGGYENIEQSIIYYKKAINEDVEFARAYAGIAISYYFLDIFQEKKIYSVEINHYADKALLLDSKLPQSLIAKSLFYMHKGENGLALPYLEKALEFNPNSALVINILSDFYTRFSPNTEKYLEYALKGISLDVAANDSATTSFTYLHVANAFVQTGFIDQAEKYINKSIDYNPENLYSEYVKAYILYAKNGDMEQTKDLLIETLKKDSTRLDVMQEIGKICFYMRDYEASFKYYKRFVDIREAYDLDIYRHDNAEIGVVYAEMGFKEESERFLNDFMEFSLNDNSLYRNLNLAMIYSYRGDKEKAIEAMRLFSEEENYHYWTVIFTPIDPLIDNIKDNPEFKKIFKEIENKFWDNHYQIKESLEDKGLL